MSKLFETAPEGADWGKMRIVLRVCRHDLRLFM